MWSCNNKALLINAQKISFKRKPQNIIAKITNSLKWKFYNLFITKYKNSLFFFFFFLFI